MKIQNKTSFVEIKFLKIPIIAQIERIKLNKMARFVKYAKTPII